MPKVAETNQAKPKASTAIDRHIGKRIRALREERKMTQTDLGRRLGVSFTQVQKYERGTDRISAARLFTIARLFGVTIADFFDGPT